jgi:tetratricopeptide (TPR) repeat protein
VQTARLEAIAGASLYMAQRPDDARTMVEEGLAAEPPPAGRAALLNTLGWLEWRLGRPEEAIAPLEESIELAAESGDDQLRRTSIHDLGIALSWGSDPRGASLLEESFELAKAAGDVNLLSRCYINLGSIRIGNGDDWREIVPFLDEGLDRSRRRVDPMSVAWIAANYAELEWYRGRVREALDLYRESVQAAARVGDRELEATRRVGMAAMTLLLGDRDRALGEFDDEVRRLTAAEAQTKAYLAAFELWLAWPNVEPVLDALVERERSGEVIGNADVVAIPAAGAALRIGRTDVAPSMQRLVEQAIGGTTGARTQRLREWARILADLSGEAAARLVVVGDDLERLGYRLLAANALADASVLAATGDGTEALALAERARSLYAGMEVVPPFGDPVEALRSMEARAAR